MQKEPHLAIEQTDKGKFIINTQNFKTATAMRSNISLVHMICMVASRRFDLFKVLCNHVVKGCEMVAHFSQY